MPIYEYACKGCGHEFEVLVRGRERPTCPACGGRSLRKLLSTFSAVASRSLPACAGRTPFCEPGLCNPDLCGRAE